MWCTLLKQRLVQITLRVLWESNSSEEGEPGRRMEVQAVWQWRSSELSREAGIHCPRTQCQVHVLVVHSDGLSLCPSYSTAPRGPAKGHRTLGVALLSSFHLRLVCSWLFWLTAIAFHLYPSTFVSHCAGFDYLHFLNLLNMYMTNLTSCHQYSVPAGQSSNSMAKSPGVTCTKCGIKYEKNPKLLTAVFRRWSQ